MSPVADDYERVSIHDVARRAGVSAATVSKVINGRYGVAASTSLRVQSVIDELGYESSLVARSLRSHRTNVIGILLTEFEPFSAEVLKGVSQSIGGTGHELLAYSAGGRAGSLVGWERRYLARLGGTLIDGALLITPTAVDLGGPVPVVAIDPHTGPATMPTVDSDNFSGALVATEHLLELGHRRIGFLGGRPDLESSRLREDGYRAALARAGVTIEPSMMRVAGYRRESALAPARELLSLPERPTAIFATNDLSAMATMDVAREIGLVLPDDLSIVGFDNVPESALTTPQLTTVSQPIQRMGSEALGLLIDLIEGKDERCTHVRLPIELVVRASTCAPVSLPAG
jgi:LacI family transcriptional regulator